MKKGQPQSEWQKKLTDMSLDSLQELKTKMQDVLDNWKTGENGQYVLQLDQVKEEIQKREKKEASKPKMS
ncbi:hypothetical protein QNI16_07150 [Cytophagaceae bacterium YF14B1]|uniref:Uncharacterized protein n=1 Tax=Xanthocytophaga flava TaxID=3048013 RepID=A0AAE3QJY6_9BACT|nr:hypothetical protein [Xanthocytophaga flavus]MDJ1480255.1 hypothetical protein [Xanthocytophaga flavus]